MEDNLFFSCLATMEDKLVLPDIVRDVPILEPVPDVVRDVPIQNHPLEPEEVIPQPTVNPDFLGYDVDPNWNIDSQTEMETLHDMSTLTLSEEEEEELYSDYFHDDADCNYDPQFYWSDGTFRPEIEPFRFLSFEERSIIDPWTWILDSLSDHAPSRLRHPLAGVGWLASLVGAT